MGLPKQRTEGMQRWGYRNRWCMAIAAGCLLTLALFDNDHFPRFLAALIFVIGITGALGSFICGLIYRREHERAPLL